MRLGPGLLYEGRTLQGARAKLADFCYAPMAEFYSAVDRRPWRATALYRDYKRRLSVEAGGRN